MNLIEAYHSAKKNLQPTGIQNFDTDIAYLLSEISGVRRTHLFLDKERKLTFCQRNKMRKAVNQLKKNKPVAYILGYHYFYGEKVLVSPHSLIPRPDTEHLVHYIEETDIAFHHILDIGCGTGVITITLARLFPEATVTGIDLNIYDAQRNLKIMKLNNAVAMRLDILDIPDTTSKEQSYAFDLIVSNPPYLSDEDMANLDPSVKKFEPYRALYGGPDGLDFYRHIAKTAGSITTNNPLLVLEVDYKWEKVVEIFQAQGYTHFDTRKDFGDNMRVLAIRK